jgi:5-hydroxyisourate hydrolase
MSHVSTHVLDTSRGRPAVGVAVFIERQSADGWVEAGRGVTDADGRVASLLAPLESGDYRLRFDTGAYFRANGDPVFYPEVVVVAILDGARRYHLPLLLSPFGYSTYRGS